MQHEKDFYMSEAQILNSITKWVLFFLVFWFVWWVIWAVTGAVKKGALSVTANPVNFMDKLNQDGIDAIDRLAREFRDSDASPEERDFRIREFFIDSLATRVTPQSDEYWDFFGVSVTKSNIKDIENEAVKAIKSRILDIKRARLY